MLELKDSVQKRQLTGFEVERLLRLLFKVFVFAQEMVVVEVLSLPIVDIRGVLGVAVFG